jgi:hypothetical protein
MQKAKKKQKTKEQTTLYKILHIKLKIGGELTCSGRVSNFCSTSDTRRVAPVTKTEISNEWEKDQKVLTTSGTYPWSFVTQVFCNGKVFPSFPMSLYLPVEAIVNIVSHITRVLSRSFQERESKDFSRDSPNHFNNIQNICMLIW